ncbi:MAG TPA: hypothetical protein VJ921_08130, partial [Vicinamibacteria bacterium]|nr:hypothetical protein [Vicinamibacteria bacterium]
MSDMQPNLYILFAAIFQTLTMATALTVVFLRAHVRDMSTRLKDDLEALHGFWGSAPNQSRVDPSDRNVFERLMIEDPERVVEHAAVLEEKYPWRDDEYTARFYLRSRLRR